ncbi:MAG: hypothetical protein H0U28_16525 [Nocardioidaceae bacterium]|nr:hypothetical protein [Nocardioidaceae bacterium]
MSAGRRSRTALSVATICLAVTACDSEATPASPPPTAPTPRQTGGECSEFTIAYDASNGYEASAFIVGRLAETELGCDVEYLRTTSHDAWRQVATGAADVYLDAYGTTDLKQQLSGPGGPVTVVGPNGVRGGVDLVAPYFMGEAGLDSFRDLPDVRRIGWGQATPAITTVPELLPLARAFVEFQELDDYAVRDYRDVGFGEGVADLLQQARADDEQGTPNLYLVEAPRRFIGDGAGRQLIAIPESTAEGCVPNAVSTLCSLANFDYLKIANSEFATSGSPAYNLVYNYRLSESESDNVLEIVELSGYDVRAADVASWINTHEDVWRRWLT